MLRGLAHRADATFLSMKHSFPHFGTVDSFAITALHMMLRVCCVDAVQAVERHLLSSIGGDEGI